VQRQGVTRSLTGQARYRFTSLVISTHARISLSQAFTGVAESGGFDLPPALVAGAIVRKSRRGRCELPKFRTWVRFPSPAPVFRKIPVDSAALTHLASLDLRSRAYGFAPILRPTFVREINPCSLLKLKVVTSSKKHGVYVTEACDKCGKILGPFRFTRCGQTGEWCSKRCRDGFERKPGLASGVAFP
jgi:hypothetical protein